MKKLFLGLLFAAIAMTLQISPASAKKKPIRTPEYQWTIELSSTPAGAKVYYNGQLICPSTPATVSIPVRGEIIPDKKNMDQAYADAKRRSTYRLTFVKEGYQTVEYDLVPSVSFQKISMFKQYVFDWPKAVSVNMPIDPNGAYAQDPTIMDGQAQTRVSRDNAGQSALERTIIRWFFDSDPRGARLFWRVISSVPAEVKNTNETYLFTTPYEETRSFNILGLTYENSRDVQIEIRISRKGYEDQIKRFNVRQAIDQQEISAFFDLVKKEE